MSVEISNRAKDAPASPIRKLVPYADKARKERNVRVFHLNIGQPDVPTPPSYYAAVNKFMQDEKVLAYSPSPGAPMLVEALQTYFADWNIRFEKRHIIPTFGASEAIVNAMMIIGMPGDEILIPEPFYANYRHFALMAGLKIVPIDTEVESEFKLPAKPEIEKLVTDKTKGILINTPNNPTGRVYSEEEIQTVRQIALERDLFIISDEVYREIIFDGKHHISPMQYEDLHDRTIIVDSISKIFSACGARIGCIASKNEDVMDVALRYAQGRLSAPTIDQFGAAAAYSDRKEYLEKIVDIYRERRDVVYEGLSNIRNTVCMKSPGAFYSLVKLPVDNAEKFIVWLLTDFQVDGETLMTAPGEGFYATPGKGINETRIAYVLEPDKLRRSLNILDAALKQYPGA